MRLLARYLVRECLVALAYCFTAFLILWIALDLISELTDLQAKKLRAGDIAAYYFFRIPDFLPVALPVALLLALLYALSNHARYNEITAIRAAGVSLWRLSLPYFSIGLLAAIVMFVSNEFFAPRTAEAAEQILTRRLERQRSAAERQQIRNVIFNNSAAGRLWHINNYRPSTSEMLGAYVDWSRPDGSQQQLNADRAVYTNGFWTFFNVKGWQRNSITNSLSVPIRVSVLPMPDFTESPEEIKSQLNVSERFGNPTRTRRADVPIAQILNYLRFNPKPDTALQSWIYTRLHGRFAGPCTCLVVVLLAVPFAAGSGRRSVFVGVAASLTIFFAFFLLQQVGFALGEAGHIPAWLGAWLPNLLFGIAGLWMVTKVR